MFIVHIPGNSQLQIGRSILGHWVRKPALQLDYLKIDLFANGHAPIKCKAGLTISLLIILLYQY